MKYVLYYDGIDKFWNNKAKRGRHWVPFKEAQTYKIQQAMEIQKTLQTAKEISILTVDEASIQDIMSS